MANCQEKNYQFIEAISALSLKQAIGYLGPRCQAILVRTPLVDPECPENSDLDILVFAEVDRLLPERLRLPDPIGQEVMIDLIWLPVRSLDSIDAFCQDGVMPHRLLSSEIVHDPLGWAAERVELVRQRMFEPFIRTERVLGFFTLAAYAVREIGITWDFPALALFWLDVAHTACVAAMCDAHCCLCPNVYTRPLTSLRRLKEETGMDLDRSLTRALRLDQKLDSMIAALRRLHLRVAARFPEPVWPGRMRSTTRFEYRYFLAAAELEWRVRAAREMADRGDPAGAVYFLRFYAYAVSRLPMVHQRALEGTDVSFMRPEKAMYGELSVLCPEILADLALLLGGSEPCTGKRVVEHLAMLHAFRDQTLTMLLTRGVTLPPLPPWEPWRPKPADEMGKKSKKKEVKNAEDRSNM